MVTTEGSGHSASMNSPIARDRHADELRRRKSGLSCGPDARLRPQGFQLVPTTRRRFNRPLVKGMARTKPRTESASACWQTTRSETMGALDRVTGLPLCAFVKSTLLCATRRNESASAFGRARGDHLTIPRRRYKTKTRSRHAIDAAARPLVGAKPTGDKKIHGLCFRKTTGDNGV